MSYCYRCLNRGEGCRCAGGPVTSGSPSAVVGKTLIVVAVLFVLLVAACGGLTGVVR